MPRRKAPELKKKKADSKLRVPSMRKPKPTSATPKFRTEIGRRMAEYEADRKRKRRNY